MSDMCPICLEPTDSASVWRLACGHQFHGACVRHWLTQSETCPICRTELRRNASRLTPIQLRALRERHFPSRTEYASDTEYWAVRTNNRHIDTLTAQYLIGNN